MENSIRARNSDFLTSENLHLVPRNENPLKMLFLKKGGKSGIHIKKKNRGKFTDYCGGKVTDSCIKRAKASGNPTLVKRATFADNARHFKHKTGGQIVQEFRLRKILNNITNN